MKRFMRSAGASSSSSAERPANVPARFSGAGESAIPFSSAIQPAISSDLKITSIRDVQRWLDSEAIASYSTVDLESIREVAAVLANSTRKEDVRPFLKKWQVERKRDSKHNELLQELKGNVIKAAQKLQQQLSDSAAQAAEQPARMEAAPRQPTACSSAEQPAPSAAEQFARMDTIDGVESDDNPMVTRLTARHRKRALDSAAEEQRPVAKPKAMDIA